MDFNDTGNILTFDRNFKPKGGGGGGGKSSNPNDNWLLNLDDGTRFFACAKGEVKLTEFLLFERFGKAVKLYVYSSNGFDRQAAYSDMPDALRAMMPKNLMEEVELESWNWINSSTFSKYMDLVEIISTRETLNEQSDISD